MCDEYYCVEKVHLPNFQQESKNQDPKYDHHLESNKMSSQDEKLHEMEEQLEIAENRCNTLKDQLDQMKKLYQTKADAIKNSRSEKEKHPRRSSEKRSDAANQGEKLSTPALPQNRGDHIETSQENDDYSNSNNNTINNNNINNNNNAAYCTVNHQGSRDGISTSTLVRQNSQAISTDTSGAAVQTINNILNGITASVNRLSQLHVRLDCDKPQSGRKSKLKDTASGKDKPESTTLAPVESRPDCAEDYGEIITAIKAADEAARRPSVMSVDSKQLSAKRKHKQRSLTKSLQHSTISVNVTTKKNLKSTAKHVEKKFKIEPVKMLNHDSSSILSPKAKKPKIKRQIRTATGDRTVSKQRLNQKLPLDPEKLVEIYHNNAAKDTDSDESNNHEEERPRESRQSKYNSETIPSLPLGQDNAYDMERFHQPSRQQVQQQQQQQQQQQRFFYPAPQFDQGSMYNQRQLTPINENNTYAEPAAPRMDCYSNYATSARNYELPTIASKMKQVAKSYMRQFNLNAIPFCAAKSTSPSHNIGINIQQVMSIIKTRQPISGISPTLAHNIGLAAEKLHNRSLSAVVSSLGSRMGAYMHCPLNRNSLNYQQLQEMAKEIPEEPDQEAMETGASGDTNRTLTWTADPLKQRNCTCIPQKGIGFQDVLNKYQPDTAIYSASTLVQPTNRSRMRYSATPTPPTKARQKMWPFKQNVQNTLEEAKSSDGVLGGKEKNLKEVLTNLHNEFAFMNMEYETLSSKINEKGKKADEESVKKLEVMEKALNNKEEEITVVMTLYKEVVALKQQVKVLKEQASVASVAYSQHHQQQRVQQQHRFRDYNDPHAAIHLTKLLRQIQTYQEMNRIGRRN